MTTFERIEKLRKNKKLSQGKLEKELGFSNGSISKWKNSTPTPERLAKIAKYFNVSVDYLLTGKESVVSEENAEIDLMISNDLELKEVFKKYIKLSDVKKKHVIELINLLSEV